MHYYNTMINNLNDIRSVVLNAWAVGDIDSRRNGANRKADTLGQRWRRSGCLGYSRPTFRCAVGRDGLEPLSHGLVTKQVKLRMIISRQRERERDIHIERT